MTTPNTEPLATPEERWERTPRPFQWVRPKLYRDQAEWLRERIAEIRDDAFEDVEKLRIAGKEETDQELADAVRDANLAVQIERSISTAYIDMLGPRAFDGPGSR